MLTTMNHRRDSAGLTYVYPVISRRAGGVSIGINLNTNKACNWACVYCQVEGLQRGGPDPVNLIQLRDELSGFLEPLALHRFMTHQVPVEQRRLVDVAFSGDGEPTSAAAFSDAVSLVTEIMQEYGFLPDVRLRLISNGSLMHRPTVQQGLRLLAEAGGEVWFKLDRVGDEAAVINGVPQSREKLMNRLSASVFCAPTWLQTCWFALDGVAPSDETRANYCKLLLSVQAGLPADKALAGVHLYGLARASSQPGGERLHRLPEFELQEFAAEITEKTGVKVLVSP